MQESNEKISDSLGDPRDMYERRDAPAYAVNNASANLVAPVFLQKKGYQKRMPM